MDHLGLSGRNASRSPDIHAKYYENPCKKRKLGLKSTDFIPRPIATSIHYLIASNRTTLATESACVTIHLVQKRK